MHTHTHRNAAKTTTLQLYSLPVTIPALLIPTVGVRKCVQIAIPAIPNGSQLSQLESKLLVPLD